MRRGLLRTIRWTRLLAVCGLLAACSSGSGVAAGPNGQTTVTPSTSLPPTSTTMAQGSGWKVVAPAPIEARKAPAVVWTGTEVLVWGGLRASGALPELSDGAAYNPKNDSWRRIAPAPAGMIGVAEAAYWVGSKVLLWAGNSPDGPAVGAFYNPYTDVWTPVAPSPLGPREGYASFQTTSEVVFVGGTRGDMIATPTAAAYNFRTNQWRVLPDELRLPDRAVAVRVSSEVMLFGEYYECVLRSSTCQNVNRRLVALDSDTETIRPVEIPTAMQDETGALLAAPSQGRALWLVGGETPRLRRYDIVLDRWDDGAAPPCAAQGIAGSDYIDGFAPTASNDILLITCDTSTTATYSIATNTWQRHDTTFPLAARANTAQVATSDGIFVWGGTEHRAGNPVLADGAIYNAPKNRAPSPSTSTATTAPVGSRACIANPKWSFVVPDGWYANTQPAGSRRSSCVVLQPRVPAANLHDGFFWLGEDEVDIGIYGIVVKDYSGSIDEMLTGAAANSGVRTSVRVTAAGVVSEAPTPNASFELLMEAANPNRLQMVRFRVVIAEDIGNLHKGDVDQGLLVTAPFGGVVRVARGGQTDVGEAEIAAALDQIAPTFVLK